jgi:6-phosphogluconate dehydrogenase (decarboxylating)
VQIRVIELGRMGGNIARRLGRGGHHCSVRSRQQHTFGERLLSAMRFQFGSHVEQPSGG